MARRTSDPYPCDGGGPSPQHRHRLRKLRQGADDVFFEQCSTDRGRTWSEVPGTRSAWPRKAAA